MLINGNWVESASGEVLPVENPARRQIIAEIPRGSAADVDRAVETAAAAFPGWARVPPRERGRMLLRIAEALESRAEEMARTIALETGNAVRTQRGAKRGWQPTSFAISADWAASSRARRYRSANRS
jgi:betaine-aldehyde dehydrogenase